MANTYTQLLVHAVFSTKDRLALIDPSVEGRLYSFIGGICRNHESPLLSAGGMPDHVHLLVGLSKNIAVADLLLHVKKDSSKWLKTVGPSLRWFAWQDGYSAFTIGESQRKRVVAYLARQKEHHRRMTFKEELIGLLQRYQVEYDERYLWD